MVNMVAIIGLVVKRPEIRIVSPTEKYYYFVLVCANKINGQNNFIDFRIGNAVPKRIIKQMIEGKRVGVRGIIINEKYIGKNGLNLKRLVVLAESITIFEEKGR